MTRNEAIAFINSLVSLRNAATDVQAQEAPAVYPTWTSSTHYKVGDRVLYNKVLYKVLQDHVSHDVWTPTEAVSLFAQILIPDENIIPEWIQPDSTNAYDKNNKVTHNGKTWISIMDGNVWEPGVYGWEEI